MATMTLENDVQTLNVAKELRIKAPLATVFDTILDQMGPGSEMPDGNPFPMKLEAWPGGRWFRDLGGDSGHLWGHVQVIKPPTLLEICGPLFMSFPATSHLQYRLAAEGSGTKLTFLHRAMGLIPVEIREGVSQGWDAKLQMIVRVAEGKLR